MQIRIPDELIELARSEDIDRMLVILGDAVRYRLTGEIVNRELLDLLDPNMRRSTSMKGKQNRLGKNKCDTHLKISVTHTKSEENKCEADLKISVTHTKNKSDTHLFIADENWLNQAHEDCCGFIYINNNILDICNRYITNNIIYTSINYQITKKGKEKYLEEQIIEAEKIIKKIGFQTFQTILQYIPQDDFRSKNILSVSKLNRKNKDGVPYYVVIMDKIKQRKPKVISIPTI